MTIDNNEENNKRKNNISTISNSSIDGIIYRPQALIPDESSVEIRAYPTRFWILAVFSFFAFYQTVVWGTFGPIMDSAQAAFGWEDSIIAILQSLGPAAVIVFILPSNWFTQTYGARKGLIGATFLMSFATGLRCISSEDEAFTALAITGGAINGIAGCTALALPPLISSLWFPPSERTTATAIGALAAQLGTAGMYLSPLIVRLPDTSNSTSVTSTVVTTVIEVVTKEDIKEDIMKLMYIECGISVGLFLCIIIYFPAEPPKPPSVSSKVERIDYFQSIFTLLRNREYLTVMGVYTFSFGIPVVWTSIMNFSLQCINIKQDEAMWIAITAALLSGLTSFLVARMTDILYGYLKITIICLLLISSLFFLWYILLLQEVIEPTLIQVYIAIGGGYAFQFASVPLLIELGVELAYPCLEAVVGASYTASFNLLALLFLLLFIIKTECYYWAGYVLVCCTSLTTIPLFFVKEKHKRSSIDGK
ncbi:UNVERIFIED_CONTAM: hypothetical protein RMT77_013016 [Armadillidium vulgare]